MDLLSSEQLIGQFPDSIVGCGAGLSVSLRSSSGAVPLRGAVPEEVISAGASHGAEGFDAEGVGVEDAAVVDLSGNAAMRFDLFPLEGGVGTVVHKQI